MSDCCLIKKVATVEVYENKNEVRAYGFMAGDRNTPIMEVKFKHLWGEENLSKCKLRWIIVDDLGSLLVGEVPIEQDNTASIQLPNELFTGERRMKVQLTVASCDGSRILNLQQFTDLKVINNLASNEVVEPVYQMLINQVYDDTKKYLAELETSYKAKYGSLESVYAKSKASLEQYLINAENGGNAEFLQGYNPKNFNRVENTINELVNSAGSKYKVGDVVEVLGYYTAGDGAHHKRKIESADDGSGVQLANGLWANIVHNGEVNVSWFGAKSTVETKTGTYAPTIIHKGTRVESDIFVIAQDNRISVDVTNPTYDWVAFQNALCLSEKTGAKVVVDKDLNLNYPVYIYSRTKVQGNSFIRPTVKKIKNDSLPMLVLQPESRSRLWSIEIRDLNFDSDVLGDFMNQYCHSYLFMEKCQVQNFNKCVYSKAKFDKEEVFNNAGIFSTFRDCAFYFNKDTVIDTTGIYWQTFIEGCIFSSNRVGVVCAGYSINILKSDFEGNGDHAITGVCMGAIRDCHFEGHKYEVIKGMVSSIENNRFINCSREADCFIKLSFNSPDFGYNRINIENNFFAEYVDSTQVKYMIGTTPTTDNFRANISEKGNSCLNKKIPLMNMKLFNYTFTGSSELIAERSNTQQVSKNTFGLNGFCSNGKLALFGIDVRTIYDTWLVPANGVAEIELDWDLSYVEGTRQFVLGNQLAFHEFIFLKIVKINDNKLKIIAFNTSSEPHPTDFGFDVIALTFNKVFPSPHNKTVVENSTVTALALLEDEMKNEGIYDSYIQYKKDLYEYENSQTTDDTMLLPVLQEPVIPESVKQFAEKYKLI